VSTVPPQRIGRYRLDAAIGSGAFASVYRAIDERLDDIVVVKVLGDNHSLNVEVRSRFIAEGRALRKVHSPHVISAYDIGENERQQPYLVLEYADRGTLADRVATLRAGGWAPDRDDLRVVVGSLAAAVEAVHRADLVHRDLSPSNVLLQSIRHPTTTASSALVPSDERLVVADLGLCKDLALNSGLTAAGGTEGFRPPEQRGGPGAVDARADLWALSALVLWVATGKRPDDGEPHHALAGAGFPPALGTALGKSLAHSPTDRYVDVADWLADVDAALRPSPSSPPPPPSAEGGMLRTRPRRVVAIAAGALLTGAALGAGATAIYDRDDGGQSVTQLDDGRVALGRVVGDSRLEMTGPDRLSVGEDATFEVEAQGVDHWAWIMPDGEVVADAPEVRIRPSSAGTAIISIRARNRDGDDVELTNELRVDP
jgi:tRNA A-37 threonylcarbamoyl transferase component Bud32